MFHSSHHLRWLAMAFVLAVAVCSTPPSAEAQIGKLIDDRAITIKSAKDVAKKRQELIDFIWGTPGMPAGKLPAVEKMI
jgi:hypothetical protein